MSIWTTRQPTTEDFPIWAYLSNGNSDMILIKDITGVDLKYITTWTRASVPQPPSWYHVADKFQVLADSDATNDWTALDWFHAGYDYGKHCKGTCGCNKRQRLNTAKAPFVDPGQYHGTGTCPTVHTEPGPFDIEV